MSIVYFTKDISSRGLLNIFQYLNIDLKGNVGVKISSGEPGGHNFLNPKMIKPLVKKVKGTIVECNTAYHGKRNTNEDHMKAIKEHGFLDLFPCDIMDSEGEVELHFEGGKHLNGINYVGSHLLNYDSLLVLSHFKGHQMGGFGGALKNISIGISSRNGKAWIHTAGFTKDPNQLWEHIDDQDGFLESMAESSKSVIDYFKPNNMVYINVANKLSIDCDCNSNPEEPKMKDIGIFASSDPVALDNCCYEEIMNSNDEGKTDLVKRMLDRHAIHIVEEAERLGIGNSNYEIIDIDSIKKEVSCGCIVLKDDKVLIVKHNAGHYSFPKGHMDNNETKEETAIREVKEETNIDVVLTDIVFRNTYVPKPGVIKDVFYYVANATSEITIKQDAEIEKAEFVSINDAIDLLTYDEHKDYLKSLI